MNPLGPSFADVLGTFGQHQFEILNEAGGQRVIFLKIFFAARPGIHEIEDLRGQAFALRGHVEAEHRVLLV